MPFLKLLRRSLFVFALATVMAANFSACGGDDDDDDDAAAGDDDGSGDGGDDTTGGGGGGAPSGAVCSEVKTRCETCADAAENCGTIDSCQGQAAEACCGAIKSILDASCPAN